MTTLPELRELVERLHKDKLALDAVANSLRDKGQWTATIRAGNAMREAAAYLSSLIEQGPVARVVNNNQPGWQNIVETEPNVTLPIGTLLYAVPRPAVPDKAYAAANPLGGPASMFRTMAERIEAGEPFDQVLRDYGVTID